MNKMIALMICGILCFCCFAEVGYPNGTYQISEKGQENAEIMRDTAMFYYYHNHKKMKEAADLLPKILERRIETPFLIFTSAVMYKEGNFPEDKFIDLARKHPESPLLAHTFATALAEKEKKEVALEILERAISYRLDPPAENEEPRGKKEKTMSDDFQMLVREYLVFLDYDNEYSKLGDFLKKLFSVYSRENLQEATLIYLTVYSVHGRERAHKEFFQQEVKRNIAMLKERMAGPNNYSYVMPEYFVQVFQQEGEMELLEALLSESFLTNPVGEGAYRNFASLYSLKPSLMNCQIRALSLEVLSHLIRTKNYPKNRLVVLLNIALDAKDEKTISTTLERVMRMKLMSDDLYYKLVLYYIEKNDLQKARSCCAEMKNQNYHDLLMGVILTKEGKHRDALILYMKMERENPTPFLKMNIAELAKKIGNKEIEMQFRNEMIYKIDQHPDYQNYIAYTWAEQGINLDQAEKYLEKALKSEPGNYAFLDSMAWVFYKKKDYQKAKKFILAALELCQEGVILDHAGDIFAALGEREKALAYWQRAAQSSDPELDQKAVLKKLPSPFVHRIKPVQNRKPKADGRKNAPAAPRKKVL